MAFLAAKWGQNAFRPTPGLQALRMSNMNNMSNMNAAVLIVGRGANDGVAGAGNRCGLIMRGVLLDLGIPSG